MKKVVKVFLMLIVTGFFVMGVANAAVCKNHASGSYVKTASFHYRECKKCGSISSQGLHKFNLKEPMPPLVQRRWQFYRIDGRVVIKKSNQ